MITTPARSDIRAFADAVRAELDDLPSDEVDDLLDGLEADLSDQAAEAGEHFALPDATTYAEELRSAAGLPDRIDSTPSQRTPIVQRLRGRGHSLVAQIRRNPAAAWALDLAASLRPVWWILRAVVLYLFIAPLFWSGYGWMSGPMAYLIGAVQFPGILLLAGLLLVSVQWGRGRWVTHRISRVIRTTVTVVAVLLTPFTLVALGSNLQSLVWDSSNDFSAGPAVTPGLAVDGQRVRNIFAFDAEGDAIPAVQLFDQDGNPLTTVGRGNGPAPYDDYFYGGGGPVPVPYTAPGASDAWNVFPLREIPAGVMSWDAMEDLAKARATAFPFLRVQPLPIEVAPTTGSESVPDAAPPTPQALPTPEPSTAPAAEAVPTPAADPLPAATPEAVTP